MHILLINTNPIVSRLFTLCEKEKQFFLEEVESITEILREEYAMIFVDEESCNDSVLRELQRFPLAKTMLLASKKSSKDIVHLFDKRVKKPFLPSDICLHIKEVEPQHIFPLASNTEEEPTQVLNGNEIERIKKILELDTDDEPIAIDDANYEVRKATVIKEHLEADGLEIVTEDEYIEGLSQELEEVTHEDAVKEMETLLLEALKKMKVKKMKKLLKGAEVTIKIKFKDNL